MSKALWLWFVKPPAFTNNDKQQLVNNKTQNGGSAACIWRSSTSCTLSSEKHEQADMVSEVENIVISWHPPLYGLDYCSGTGCLLPPWDRQNSMQKSELKGFGLWWRRDKTATYSAGRTGNAITDYWHADSFWTVFQQIQAGNHPILSLTSLHHWGEEHADQLWDVYVFIMCTHIYNAVSASSWDFDHITAKELPMDHLCKCHNK